MSGKNYQDLIAWQKAMDQCEAAAANVQPAELVVSLNRAAELGRLITGLAESKQHQRHGHFDVIGRRASSRSAAYCLLHAAYW